MSDEEWVLKIKSLYPWVNWDDVNREMDAWLLNNPGRQKTRRFITNWLIKKQKDKPVIHQPKRDESKWVKGKDGYHYPLKEDVNEPT